MKNKAEFNFLSQVRNASSSVSHQRETEEKSGCTSTRAGVIRPVRCPALRRVEAAMCGAVRGAASEARVEGSGECAAYLLMESSHLV